MKALVWEAPRRMMLDEQAKPEVGLDEVLLRVAYAGICGGAAITRGQCVAATCSAGTLILSGLHEETSAMPVAEIIRREIVVHGSFAYSPANFAEALDRLACGTMRLDPWMVEAPLADGGKWFDRLVDAPRDVAKVLLVP